VKADATAAKRADSDAAKAGKKAAAAVEEGTEEGAPAAPEAEVVPSPSLGAGPAGPPLS
jgi:hypothetical protein